MGLLDRLTRWIRSETADVKDAVGRIEDDLDAELSRRERELSASPSERMEMIQAEGGADDLLAEVQAKIDAQQAKAEAVADLTETDHTAADQPAAGADGTAPDAPAAGGTDDEAAAGGN